MTIPNDVDGMYAGHWSPPSVDDCPVAAMEVQAEIRFVLVSFSLLVSFQVLFGIQIAEWEFRCMR